MQIKFRYVAPLLGATAAVVAIAAAPIAGASSTVNQQNCTGAGTTDTVCQSPGNVQINDMPPPVSFYPYGGDAFLLGGGFGGGGFGGGFHGGGGHGGGHR